MDVTEASVIIVHHAERFGLSTLHQLRGRVGRSTRASKCFLVNAGGEASHKKLQLLVEEHDGMTIAKADMENRCETRHRRPLSFIPVLPLLEEISLFSSSSPSSPPNLLDTLFYRSTA